MFFLLTTLKVAYVISTPRPSEKEDETPNDIHPRSKWDNDDFIYRGHILNGMSNTLFHIYQNIESVQEMWSLKRNTWLKMLQVKKFLK